MANSTLTRGQKAAATRKANAARAAKQTNAVSELLPETPRKATGSVATVDTATGTVEKVQPEEEVKDTSAKPETLATVSAEDETPEGLEVPTSKVEKEVKERRMNIAAHFVPGRAALATLTADALKELAFVSTYSSADPQSTSPRLNGYQREPMEERFPGIGRYYSTEGKGHLIPALIVNVRTYTPEHQARFNTLFNKGDIATIHKEFGKDVFSIVDGQHRAGGLYWAWGDKRGFNPDVPVTMYYGLRYTEEANLFDDVNTNQRRLPKALIESTRLHLEAGEKTHQQEVREIAFALSQDGDSVWHGLVNMTGGKLKDKLPVTFEGMRRSVGNMMHEKVLGRLRQRGLEPDAVAKKYWEIVSRACSTAWNDQPRFVEDESGETVEEKVNYQIKNLAGVGALSRLGADIIGTALDKSKIHEEFWSVVADLVSKLGAVDWTKEKGNPWTSSGAGFAGASGLYKILFDLVYLDKSPGVAVTPNGNGNSNG